MNPRAHRLRRLKGDADVSFVPMESVGEFGGLRLDEVRNLVDIESASYTEFEEGDVVVAKITPCFENGKGALARGLTNGCALGTTELHVLRAKPSLDREFLFYLTISQLYRSRGEAEMYGAGGQKRVPPEFCKDFLVPLPPSAEQHAIASFLDRETAKIDTLVEKKRALVEKLAEKRSALISRTVTRGLPPEAARAAGLDPHPKLKPSGVEWLGEVPEHWEVKRLRHVGQAQIGLTYEPGNVTDESDGTLVLRASNIQAGKVAYDDNVFVNVPIPAALITRVGDILICSRSGSRDLVGKNVRIDRDSAGHTFGAFMTLLRSDANDFLYFVLNSGLFEFQSSLFSTSTINQLTLSNLYAFEVPVPPMPEQRAIASYLDRETAKIDALVAKVETAIERLQEYRAALITAAVTGKIDVRGAASAATSAA